LESEKLFHYITGVISLANPVAACRICGNTKLIEQIDLGNIALSGVFLNVNEEEPKAQLVLSKCASCHLVQLMHSYPNNVLYGDSYGYESNLNTSMARHLMMKARILEQKYLSTTEAVVVDIASNDGTLLSGYRNQRLIKVGIDPLIEKVSDYYPKDSIKILDFFSSKVYWEKLNKPADLVTSISVIYDLDQPIQFAREVNEILSENGIWHFEQSYLPLMVATNSYDTICHEHLLYLTLNDIKFILDSSNFTLIDVSMNDTNGGSIAVTAQKGKSNQLKDPNIEYILMNEKDLGFQTNRAMEMFVQNAHSHKKNLTDLIFSYKNNDFEIFGLGASTKGNVLLQWLGLDKSIINSIGDINPKKFGKVTPGTKIPIVKETEILQRNSYNKVISLVLPWHFRQGFTERAEQYLVGGGKLLFPLPRIETLGIT
jgi:hypothetical protein